jgi:NADH-quinone oxidoreductase subunit N
MNVMLFVPELWVMFGCLLLFMGSIFNGSGRQARLVSGFLSVTTILLTACSLYLHGSLFFDVYRVDLFSQLFKFMVAVGLTVVILFDREVRTVAEEVKVEYYLFLFLSSLGLMMVVSCVELLSLFIALELSSFALYLLVPMRNEATGVRTQMEAAAKYIIFGVMATGIMLFGMSYLFGLTGTTYLAELLPRLHGVGAQPAAVVGIIMVLAGFFFKLGLFPFHFWLPDVYQGSANETTAFIASVPKLAAVALLIRVSALAMPESQAVSGLLGTLAVISMFYGNLLALTQKDIKRMLGFSGIAHAGYVILGILVLGESGYAASIFYIVGYLVMNLAAFLVICNVSVNGENLLVDDLSGLYKRAPLLALILAVAMFGLAGIPPFVGFMGKFMLLTGALQKDYLAVVILAAINTAIAIYYYLSVVRVVYCAAPEKEESLPVSGLIQATGVFLVIVIVWLGVAPNGLLEMAGEAVKTIL